MNATLTLDGVAFIIEIERGDIKFHLPGEMAESIVLSPRNAQLLATCILTACEELENN